MNKLSICVITMNRSKQLLEALNSCINCELPSDTEIIIIDNASDDDTETIARDFISNCDYTVYYEKLNENIGVGRGRNYAYSKTTSEYIYILDDDAIICDDKKFFINAIEIFESNPQVATLTTQIYDTALKINRRDVEGKELCKGVYFCEIFCGGSHFLRKKYYPRTPYFQNEYGHEEILPSWVAIENGYYNVYCPNLKVIHKPLINKWDYSKEENKDLLAIGITLPYIVKRMMFPAVFRPLMSAIFWVRKMKYIGFDKKLNDKSREVIKETYNKYYIKRCISISTVLRAIRIFGIKILY